MKIKYILEFDHNRNFEYEVNLDRQIDFHSRNQKETEWLKLEFNKCEICSLDSNEYCYCPVMFELYDIAIFFGNISSIDRLKATVITKERTYFKECDSQTALSSLIGVIMATGQCPILSKLKSMAYFHLPFANFEETLVRSLSSFLIKQYFKFHKGESPDLDLNELSQLYKDLGIVNRSLNKRLLVASRTDANANAIVIFFSLSSLVEFSIEEKMNDLVKYFG